MNRPNTVLIALITVAAAALAVVVLAAEAHGKRRARRAWLIERGAS